jgi:transposase
MAYKEQFKEEAIRLVTDRGYTPTSASRELGIPINTLNQWLRKAGWKRPGKSAGSASLPEDPAALKQRVRELEAENHRLRMEKEILKKATAYFANQNP